MKKSKVVVVDGNFPDFSVEKKLTEENNGIFEVHQLNDEDKIIEKVKEAHVVLVQFSKITEKIIAGMKKGAVIIRYGVGCDNIDIQSAKKYGVKVAIVPDYGTEAVVEHTLAMGCALLRQLWKMDRSVRDGFWDGIGTSGNIKPFDQITAGIFGFGIIGKKLAEVLSKLGISVVFFDPAVTENSLYSAKKIENLDDFFKLPDIFFLHAPGNEKTKKIINKSNILKMKKEAYLVNTARGELVDEEDLSWALSTKRIAGAALDVFPTEPLNFDSPLRGVPNLLMSPHMAFFTTQSIRNLQRLAGEEIARVLRKEPLRCPVF